MRLLITNDDGIFAPGIAALAHAVADLGAVEIVAPADSQSATSHAISVLKPLRVRQVDLDNRFHGWSVGGRPADCVKLALVELLRERRPDFVLSGINAGANTGINILYSGTVAAALEGALFGVPSIAFSLELSAQPDFEKAGRVARAIFQHYAAARPAAGTCLSVNIPALEHTEPGLPTGPVEDPAVPPKAPNTPPLAWPRGVRCCPQAPVNWEEQYAREVDADGEATYWLNGRLSSHNPYPDGDVAALRAGYVVVTPLRPDLSDRARVGEIAAWPWPARFGE